MNAPRSISHRRPLFELALTGPVESVSAFRRGPIIKALRRDRGRWSRSTVTRYETPDKRLDAQGFTIEVREANKGRAQIIARKSPFEGVIGQNEVRTRLGPNAPFPAETGVLEFDSPVASVRERLDPTTRTTTDQWSVTLGYRGSAVACSFHFLTLEEWDIGGARRATPIAFVRFENATGRDGAVFDLARIAAKEAGLFPDARVLSPAPERFIGAFDIAPAPKVMLDPSDTPDHALSQAIKIAANRVIELRPAIVDRRDVRGLQQMRVALRRLRAIERLYRPYLTDPTLFQLAKKARRFARRMGPARDWDVFVSTMLPMATEDGYASSGFEKLRWSAEALRAEAWDEVIDVVTSRGFSRFAVDLLETGRNSPWRKGADRLLDGPVTSFSEIVLDAALDNAIQVASEVDVRILSTRHPLRIALKKVRYAAQTFRSLYPKERRKPYMSQLSRFQDSLGKINDVATAQLLADFAAKGEGEDVVRAAGFLYGVQAPPAELAASEVDDAWAAFENASPFWRN